MQCLVDSQSLITVSLSPEACGLRPNAGEGGEGGEGVLPGHHHYRLVALVVVLVVLHLSLLRERKEMLLGLYVL